MKHIGQSDRTDKQQRGEMLRQRNKSTGGSLKNPTPMDCFKPKTPLYFLQNSETPRCQAEQELRKSEERFRFFFENAPDYCYMISPEGTILDVNRSALSALGYKKDELLGKPLKIIYAPESFPKMRKLFATWKRAGRLKNEELIISTKNGDKRTVLLSAEAMRGKDGKILHSISIQKDITERKRIEAELDRSHKKLRGLSAHLFNLREKERKRIAHAVHDDLGQLLAVLDMDLDRLFKKLLPGQKSLQVITKSLMAQVKRIAETVQRISTELRPKLLDDVGLVPAIKWQVQEFQNHTGIRCRVNIDTDGINPDIKKSVVIFRILQESLTNVARHAQATRIKVSLRTNSEKLILIINDNGKGITQRQITDVNSFGILGMQESVLPWEGSFDINGIKNKGTTIRVSLPLISKNESR